MKRSVMCLVSLVLLLGEAGQAEAGVIFDNSSLSQDTTSVISDFGITTNIIPSTDTTITQFANLTKFPDPATVDFFIVFHHTNGLPLLYNSGPVSFGADSGFTWKSSPNLSFTLFAGVPYDVGMTVALSNPLDNYLQSISDSPFTQNGITSTTNGIFYTANPPAFAGTFTGDVDLRLFGTVATSVAPEPASLTMLGIGALGLLGYGWRRRK